MCDEDYETLRQAFIETDEFQELLKVKDFEKRRRLAKQAWRRFITR